MGRQTILKAKPACRLCGLKNPLPFAFSFCRHKGPLQSLGQRRDWSDETHRANRDYFTCLSWMALVGFAYRQMSRGLAAHSSKGPFLCHELHSAGSEDDAMIAAFVLVLLPLLLRFALIKRRPSVIELLLFCFCLAVTVLALWLASLDCADIFYTAFGLPDAALAAALIALPCASLALLGMRLCD